MKRKLFHITALFLSILILCTTIAPVFAEDSNGGISPQASNYISSYSAYVEAGSTTGSLKVQFNITATGKMTSLGASKIQIYNSSGTCVKTFYSTSTTGMMASNRFSYSSSVTYTGATSGAKYYAVITFKASNSSGGDSGTYTTSYGKAK